MADERLIATLASRARRRVSRRTRRLEAPKFPTAQELAYISVLTSLSEQISARIEKRIFNLLAPQRQDAVDKSALAAMRKLKSDILGLVNKQATKHAQSMAMSVNKANRKHLNAHWNTLIGLQPWKTNKGLEAVLKTRVKENVALIQSIAAQQLDQVTEVVRAGVTSGTRVETIRDQIQERFGVSRNRAELVARDQVGKLNAALSARRQQDIGADAYTWQTSRDERVRDTHSDLHGTKQKFSKPPVTNEQGGRNNPGEDFQCRCNAIADVESVLRRLGI